MLVLSTFLVYYTLMYTFIFLIIAHVLWMRNLVIEIHDLMVICNSRFYTVVVEYLGDCFLVGYYGCSLEVLIR